MNTDELRRRVAAFDRWHYRFDLPGGVRTPIFDPEHAVRHQQRRQRILDPVARWLGGLAGKRVLDLGCNAGFWSLYCVEEGAEFVRGIDGRAEHIEQAELVREANDISPDRWSLEQGDVLTADLDGSWDVVLCLGLLYHVDRPNLLLQRIAEAGAPIVVIDTEVHPGSGVRGVWGTETPSDPRSATASERVKVLTAEAIVTAMQRLHYDVALLDPDFTDWRGSADYRGGWRRAFVCSRDQSLETLPAPTEAVRGRVRQRVRWLRWLLWRLRGRKL